MIDRSLLCKRLEEGYRRGGKGVGPECCGMNTTLVNFHPHATDNDMVVIQWQCTSCGKFHEHNAILEARE